MYGVEPRWIQRCALGGTEVASCMSACVALSQETPNTLREELMARCADTDELLELNEEE